MPEYAVGVDLGWKRPVPLAVATVNKAGSLHWRLCADVTELLYYCRNLCAPDDLLVLLDVPIHGVGLLSERKEHFRPVDKAFSKSGLWIRPSSSALDKGPQLFSEITRDLALRSPQVVEIYPYAIYKFMDFLSNKNSLHVLRTLDSQSIMDVSFKRYCPLPYKNRSEQINAKGRENLYGLLMNNEVGLSFAEALPKPDRKSYCQGAKVDDVYDACLGAVLGWHMLRDSPWAVVKGDREHGEIALLADAWLSIQLDQRLALERVS